MRPSRPDLSLLREHCTMADDAALLEALRQVVDPELMINVVDLGLIYDIEQVDNKVTVQMTLTSPACPAGPQLIQQAKMALEKLSDVSEAEIKLVMSPPWTPDRMTDDARDQLGIF
jgi:metal-sulfur cluster biosynthetic enzyme